MAAEDAPRATDETRHRVLGMTDEEYAAAVSELGRDPSDVELAMYSVMWSEHCSYKSSKVHLRRLPSIAPWVLVGPGEGAGVVEVGGGFAVALRIESHNHPSAVEPYQGAATGVGGIVRDILSMGARPIALMDPLRFGPLDDVRTRYLFERVVRGISGYGNAVGVPTVGGDLVFDEGYRDNPLVNVLCLGILPIDRLVLARAEGEDNLAVLLGGSTGRDGIGGASVLASAGFEEASEQKRPSVQVGDPFEEKKCIEACLALLEAGLVLGVQDLGAAGLACAASETAAKTGAGMDVDVARVTRRERGMSPTEVMTSESQERMLAIVEPGRLDAVFAVAQRWEVDASVVGRVTTTGRFRVFDGVFDAWGVPGRNPAPPSGETVRAARSDRLPVADVPIESLGDGPVYHRPLRARERDASVDDPDRVLPVRFPSGTDLGPELLALLASPNIADRSWVYRQYDHQLFLNTVRGPGGDAAVLRLQDVLGAALALSVDGKAAFCALDARRGACLAVLEAARNVACAGARPLALVNCLNFGNPEHPEVMGDFSDVVDGIAEACTALAIPVIGGNVSFYNESRGSDIDPTPIVGVVGLIDDLGGTRPPGLSLHEGEVLVLLGGTASGVAPAPDDTAPGVAPAPDNTVVPGPEAAGLGGSEWALRHGLRGGTAPGADLAAAAVLHELVRTVVAGRGVTAVHDCSEGGLAVTVAEMAIAGGVGAEMALETAAECFGEAASRVVVALGPGRVDALLAEAGEAGVPGRVIGTAGGDRLRAPGLFDVVLADAAHAWRTGLPAALGLAPPDSARG